jgi:hypothetical protein
MIGFPIPREILEHAIALAGITDPFERVREIGDRLRSGLRDGVSATA